jgi:pimeloyl-ACP methyl ester carboxylesterase
VIETALRERPPGGMAYALRHPQRVAGLLLVATAPRSGFRAESVDVARRRGTPEMLADRAQVGAGGPR